MSASVAMEAGIAAAAAMREVMARVKQAAERSGGSSDQVRIVAVSKTKPASLIKAVYDSTGHRSFGENYVQEMLEKCPQLPEDIEWHFIGNLQSNKAKALLSGVPNLYMVESVDDEKIANYLDRAVGSLGRNPLKVLVQVNTSGEESKFGVEPSGCVELAMHVKLSCPNLIFSGLMTIGMLDYSSTPQNFQLTNYQVMVPKIELSCTSFFYIAGPKPGKEEGCDRLGESRHCLIAERRFVRSWEWQKRSVSYLWACLLILNKQLKWAALMLELGRPYLEQGNIQRRTSNAFFSPNYVSVKCVIMKCMVIVSMPLRFAQFS